MNKKSNLIVCGDIHNRWMLFLLKLEDLKIDNSYIIIAGDIGVGFINKQEQLKELEDYNTELKKINCIVYCVRGNHDNPNYFNGDVELSNIKFVQDYTVLNLELLIDNKNLNINILCIGGAISIDRNGYEPYFDKRIKNINYWENEINIYDENKINNIDCNIDIVVTHTAPSFCVLQNNNGIIQHYLNNDSKLSDDLDLERINMDKVYNKLLENKHNFKMWYFGHFHFSFKCVINDIQFNALDKIELHSPINNFLD